MDRDDHSAQNAPTLINPSSPELSSPLPTQHAPHARKQPKPRKRRKGVNGHRNGASVLTKTFVLDTNVLLHDPACIDRFADNHICIPVDVLSELDRFKNEMTERGANAREVHRALMKVFSKNDASVTDGVATSGGGTLRVVVYDPADHDQEPAMKSFRGIFPNLEKTDHRILACTISMRAKSRNPGSIILVSKDLNMQLKARAVGLECQDYLHDKVEPREVASNDIARLEVTPHELQRFASSGRLTLPASRLSSLDTNDYVLLTAGEKATIPARLNALRELVKLLTPEVIKVGSGCAIKPMNLGQSCLLDALLDPSISLVTCYGQAGTGKTLLAVAAGLQQVFGRTYRGLTVSRPIVAMGQTVGFLPGSLQEKMRPWLQPVYDALDLLMRPDGRDQGPNRKRTRSADTASTQNLTTDPVAPYDSLIQSGVIEVEALCYIRGRSIPDRFFVMDEAQQLTPLEAKTVVTRMSRGSKLILVGDPGQIDNPYVDSRSNGLVYTRQRMRGQPFSAHVPLLKGERSPLAEAAAKLL